MSPLPCPRWLPLVLGAIPLLGAMPLVDSGLAWAQFDAQPAGEAGGSQAPNRPAAPLAPQLPAGGAASLAPLRPSNASLASPPPRRFDESLDNLVRQGVVTPTERSQIRQGGALVPIDVPAQQQACRIGALSEQECRVGFAVRWRRHGQSGLASGLDAGLDGGLQSGLLPPPISVPVSALLAGGEGSFSLSSVFRLTPRPLPLAGNGDRLMLFPIIGSAITTSTFGYRLHPLLGSWLMHAGRDLAAPEGTPVVAALSGLVMASGPAGGYGLAVELEHRRPRRRTLYGHLSELYVRPGDWVRQGEVIGRVGSTGLSTGPHLHFEVRQPADGGWVAVEPGELDPGRGLAGQDAVAQLMGQLLQSLERPKAPADGQAKTKAG